MVRPDVLSLANLLATSIPTELRMSVEVPTYTDAPAQLNLIANARHEEHALLKTTGKCPLPTT